MIRRIVVLLEIWRQNHYKIFIMTPKYKKVINKKERKKKQQTTTFDNLYLCFKLVTMIASFANNRIVVSVEGSRLENSCENAASKVV